MLTLRVMLEFVDFDLGFSVGVIVGDVRVDVGVVDSSCGVEVVVVYVCNVMRSALLVLFLLLVLTFAFTLMLVLMVLELMVDGVCVGVGVDVDEGLSFCGCRCGL